DRSRCATQNDERKQNAGQDDDLRLQQLERDHLPPGERRREQQLHFGDGEIERHFVAAEEPPTGDQYGQAECVYQVRRAVGARDHETGAAARMSDEPEVGDADDERDRVPRLPNAARPPNEAIHHAARNQPRERREAPPALVLLAHREAGSPSPVSARKMSSSPSPASCGRSAMMSSILPIATVRPP